jgi:hypothetical protein
VDDVSTGTLGVALAVLLVTSGFFSIAETAMMACNRFRLKHQAQRGAHGARIALALLGETDRLLGVILLATISSTLPPPRSPRSSPCGSSARASSCLRSGPSR